MDAIEIRPIAEDEFPTAVRLMGVAFAEEWTEDDVKAYQASFPFERSLCAFENGKMVATSAVLSLELTLPGHVSVPMGGVTWIGTLPTHRRRGLLRRLMLAQAADMMERGETISGLGASEGNIYGRFGYGPATHFASFRLERARARFSSPVDDASAGRITLLDTDEAAAQLPAIFDGLRLRQPGMVRRSAGLWQEYFGDPTPNREGAGRMFHCMHETTPGRPDGYVSYRVKEEWSGETPAYEVRVVELVAADLGTYRALWDYIIDTDLAATITCWRGRVDEPLRWQLADLRQFKVEAVADFLWLRLLDVPRALAARAYSCPGELVLDVTESFPVPRRVRYALRADGTGADAFQGGSAGASGVECTVTKATPDLALAVETLASAYLGGGSFATLAAAGRVQELRAGAIAQADAMFHTGAAPYSFIEF